MHNTYIPYIWILRAVSLHTFIDWAENFPRAFLSRRGKQLKRSIRVLNVFLTAKISKKNTKTAIKQLINIFFHRAVDLDSDQTLQVNPDTGFWWPKTDEKKIQLKFFNIFFYKNCNLLRSKLQENPSALKREHKALQKMKFINFFSMFVFLFLPSWIQIRISNSDPDTDPGTPLDTDTGTPLNKDPERKFENWLYLWCVGSASSKSLRSSSLSSSEGSPLVSLAGHRAALKT